MTDDDIIILYSAGHHDEMNGTRRYSLGNDNIIIGCT